MVAMNDDGPNDCSACPGCRFKMALANYFTESRRDGDEEWHWATGDLRRHMHAALLALDGIEATAFGDASRHDDHDHASDAASALYAIEAELPQLWHVLMDDDSQGDVPGDGL
jgi:hypothetical protein